MIWYKVFNVIVLLSIYHRTCIVGSFVNQSTLQQQNNSNSLSITTRVFTPDAISTAVPDDLNSKLAAYCTSRSINIIGCQCPLLNNHLSGFCSQNSKEKLTTLKREEVLTEKCTEYQIPSISCTCEKLKIHSDEMEYNMVDKCQKSTITINDLDNALGFICESYNIALQGCSCQTVELHIPGFCGNYTKDETFKKILINSNGSCTLNKYIIGQISFTVFASIIGMSGNALVLLVRSKVARKSLHYQLIFGLAMADFTFSILTFVYNIPSLFVGCKWIYERAMCKVMPALLGLSSSIDLGFIVIIAIERYVAIVHPLSGGVSRKHMYLLIVLNGVISMIAVIPLFIVNDIYDGKCQENWARFGDSSLVYSWNLMVVLFLVPVLATTYLYYKSLQSLKQTLFRREMLVTVNASSRNKLIAENKRILLVLSSLLIAFVLFVSPNRIAWLVMDYMAPETTSPDVFIWLKIFGLVPYSLHISVNPIIYSVVDKRFRKTAIHLLKKRKRMLTSSSSFVLNSTSFAVNTNDATAM